MKTIGLIGGMSWESSAILYTLINRLVAERLGGYHSARCVMTSVDFAEIESMQSRGAWAEAAAALSEEGRRLERAGVDVLVLCTNTMHKVADEIAAAVGVPLLHIADVTAVAVRDAGVERVGLLGTRFTMEQDFYRDRITGHGIEVVLPDAGERDAIHRVIYDELVHGVVRDDSRQEFRRIIDSLASRGAEGVILGCTEIEMLIGNNDVDLPVFPTTRIHAEAAVEWALTQG